MNSTQHSFTYLIHYKKDVIYPVNEKINQSRMIPISMNKCTVALGLLYHSLIILIEFANRLGKCEHIKILEIYMGLLHGTREKSLPPTNYASVH